MSKMKRKKNVLWFGEYKAFHVFGCLCVYSILFPNRLMRPRKGHTIQCLVPGTEHDMLSNVIEHFDTKHHQ